MAERSEDESSEAQKIPPIGLVALPFEIRLQIYNYLIPQRHLVEVSNPAITYKYEEWDDMLWKNKTSIFRISKQMSEEALDVLYGSNEFKLYLNGGGEAYFKWKISKTNRGRILSLEVVAQAEGRTFKPRQVPDYALWSSILPQLRTLRIVAAQPSFASYFYQPSQKEPNIKGEIKTWMRWLPPYLECFGRYVSMDTAVEVDINGMARTEQIVRASFPNGYRKVQCPTGELIFGSRLGFMNSEDRDEDDWEAQFFDM